MDRLLSIFVATCLLNATISCFSFSEDSVGFSEPDYWEIQNETEITSIKISEDLQYVAVGKANGKISIYRRENREVVDTVDAHDGPVIAMCFAENVLASVGTDGQFCRWQIGNLNLQSKPIRICNGFLSDVKHLSDDTWLVLGANGISRITGESVSRSLVNARAMDISNSRELIAIGQVKSIAIKNLRNFEDITVWETEKSSEGHHLPDNVSSLDFSNDGKCILILSSRRSNIAISIVKEKTINCFQFSGDGYRFRARFSPDERFVIADGHDFIIFDSETKRLVKQIQGPSAKVVPIPYFFTCFDSFKSEGSVHIVVGCRDGKVFDVIELGRRKTQE